MIRSGKVGYEEEEGTWQARGLRREHGLSLLRAGWGPTRGAAAPAAQAQQGRCLRTDV